jgi:hypothetical protein
VRLGQHSELTTKLFVNVTPCATSSRSTVGIAESVSQRWSSVSTTTIFGRSLVRAEAAGAARPAPAHAAKSASASAVTPAKYARRLSISPPQLVVCSLITTS